MSTFSIIATIIAGWIIINAIVLTTACMSSALQNRNNLVED